MKQETRGLAVGQHVIHPEDQSVSGRGEFEHGRSEQAVGLERRSAIEAFLEFGLQPTVDRAFRLVGIGQIDDLNWVRRGGWEFLPGQRSWDRMIRVRKAS